MNSFNKIVNFFKENAAACIMLIVLLAVSSVTTTLSSLSFSNKATIPETVANRIEYLCKNDPYKRSNIVIEDGNGLLCVNNYHVKMMSYIGKNNSIFCRYNETLEIKPLNSEKKAIGIQAFGITNCGNGYVYGQTTEPYGTKIINGSYSPSSALYDDTANNNERGCIISEDLAHQLFESKDPTSEQISLKFGERYEMFTITAVTRNQILCNDYKDNSSFVMTNFMFLKQLFNGQCSLIFRLKNEYNTNLSIFQRLFSKIYIKNYSAERLSINFGDEQLNSYVHKTIMEEYSASKLTYLGYVQVPLQMLIGFLVSLLIEKRKWTVSSAFYIFITLLFLLFSFSFADLLNGIHIGAGYYNSKSSITTVFFIMNAVVMIFAVLVTFCLLESYSSPKNKISRNYKIDI